MWRCIAGYVDPDLHLHGLNVTLKLKATRFSKRLEPLGRWRNVKFQKKGIPDYTAGETSYKLPTVVTVLFTMFLNYTVQIGKHGSIYKFRKKHDSPSTPPCRKLWCYVRKKKNSLALDGRIYRSQPSFRSYEALTDKGPRHCVPGCTS